LGDVLRGQGHNHIRRTPPRVEIALLFVIRAADTIVVLILVANNAETAALIVVVTGQAD
jgi:hypothetical protein